MNTQSKLNAVFEKLSAPHFLKATVTTGATAALALVMQVGVATQAKAQAGVFEVIHPEVEQGQVEVEVLSGFGLSNVEEGDERSEHEFALGFGITDFWKFTAALEVANPRGESLEVEAFEIENLFLLPFFGDDHHDKGKEATDDHHGGDFSLGLFTAFEIPINDGIQDGAIEFGPVFEVGLGPLEWVGNVLVELPFAGGEDAGLSYASQVIFPVTESIGVGFENFGEFEGVFEGGDEEEHVVGPAIYYEYELPNGHVLEPRAAVLFGLNDESPDAVLSFNIEYKFGG